MQEFLPKCKINVSVLLLVCGEIHAYTMSGISVTEVTFLPSAFLLFLFLCPFSFLTAFSPLPFCCLSVCTVLIGVHTQEVGASHQLHYSRLKYDWVRRWTMQWYNGLNTIPMCLSVCQDEVVQEEELQEEDQEVIETWTGTAQACTCDCQGRQSPTANPATTSSGLATVLAPLSSSQDRLLNCMPGEDSALVT